MPHPATHITIVQRLAQSDPAIAAVLGSPDPNIHPDQGQAGLAAVRKMRFASLGAVGPDLFYFLADFRQPVQDLEDVIVMLMANFAAIEQAADEIDKVQSELAKAEAVLTCGISTIKDQLFGDGIATVTQLLAGNLTSLLGKLAIDAGFNPASLLEPPRQKDQPRSKWFWADYLHYVHTGDFTATLLQKSRLDPKYKDHPHLFAYALGYFTHYVADTVGHPYVNQIVQAPYRLYWQRHALVENFIDAYVWDRWHKSQPTKDPLTGKELIDPATGDPPLHQLVAPGSPNVLGKGAPLLRARLHDLVDCGTAKSDPLDKYLGENGKKVFEGIGTLAGLEEIGTDGDPDLVLWTEFMADCLAATYGGIPHPTRLTENNGLPTAANIGSAYSVARFFLKLISDESIEEPVFPDIAGDLNEALEKLWNDLKDDLGKIPSPPGIDTRGKFDFASFWKQVKA